MIRRILNTWPDPAPCDPPMAPVASVGAVRPLLGGRELRTEGVAGRGVAALDTTDWYDYITKCQIKEVHMNPVTLKEKLIAVLGQIQADSGLECPSLTGATKPIDNIPKFDSKVWPVATTILSTEIGTSIPNDVNIFVDDTTKLPRSIDEAAVFVCELLKNETEKKAATA